MRRKKSLIKIVSAVLVVILSVGLVGSLVGNITKKSDDINTNSGNDILPPVDDPGNDEEPETPGNPGELPEVPGDEPGENTPDDDQTTNLTVFYEEENLLLNHTYNTSSEVVKTYSYTTEYALTNEKSAWELKLDASDTTSNPNRCEIVLPTYTSGQYVLSFKIKYNDEVPSSSLLVRYNGTVDILSLCNFGGENDNLPFDDYYGSELTFTINFDFDSNLIYFLCVSSKSQETYSKKIDVTEISGGIREVPFVIRYDIVHGQPVVAHNISFGGFLFSEGMTVNKEPEVDDTPVEDNASTNVIFRQNKLNIFDYGLSTGTGEYTVSTYSVITDFHDSSVDRNELKYKATGNALYGENSVNINLPNVDSGVYEFRLKLKCTGTSSFFFPTFLNFYLKSPGLLNTTQLFHFNKTLYNLASWSGYNFEYSEGERNAAEVELSFLFDYNEDVVTVKIYDLDGRAYNIGSFSLELYRQEKDLPITLRIQIPPNQFEVNKNCYSLSFLDWSFKEII